MMDDLPQEAAPVDIRERSSAEFEMMVTLAGLHLDKAQMEALRGGYRHMQIMMRRTLDAPAFQTADTNVLGRLHRRDAGGR